MALHLAASCQQPEGISYLLDLCREKYPDKLQELVNEESWVRVSALDCLLGTDGIESRKVESIRLLAPLSDLTQAVYLDDYHLPLSYLECAVHKGELDTLECLLEFPFSDVQIVLAMIFAFGTRDKECHELLKREAYKRGLLLDRGIAALKNK